MLRIRLRRVGKKKQPMYRIVVADSRSPRDGAFVEALGYYHPLDNPSTIVIDADRARHWLERGAQPSDRVAKLLAIQSIAEIPPKLKARIELGAQRAKEAEQAKPAKEALAAVEAVAVAEEDPAAEAAAEEAPAVEAVAEEPAAEEEQPEAAPAEPEATAEPEVAEDAGEEEQSEA